MKEKHVQFADQETVIGVQDVPDMMEIDQDANGDGPLRVPVLDSNKNDLDPMLQRLEKPYRAEAGVMLDTNDEKEMKMAGTSSSLDHHLDDIDEEEEYLNVVKLYQLNDHGQWDDCGTGFVDLEEVWKYFLIQRV